MKKTRKKFIKIFLAIVIIILFTGVTIFLYQFYNYKQGEKFQENKEYDKAISCYQKIKFVYDKAKNNEQECYYQKAIELRNKKDYENSILYFEKSNNYNDSQEQIKETKYQKVINKYENGDFEEAKNICSEINEYKDIQSYLENIYIMIELQGVWYNEESKTILEISQWKINKYSVSSSKLHEYKIIYNKNGDYDWYYKWWDNQIVIENKEVKMINAKGEENEFNKIQYNKSSNILNEEFIYTIYAYQKSPDINIIELKKPKIGMTKNEVLNSTWGKPEDINKTTTKYGIREQWCYSGYKYIYFEDGIVTSIQD